MAERLEIIITATDRASSVARDVGRAFSGAFKTGLAIGATGTVALGGALAWMVGEALEAEETQARLASVIESTGGKAGWTADEANDLAQELANLTRFSDDTIISAETMLLTFTNIGEDVMPQATEAVLNMGEMFGSTESAAVMLGKALNDPVAGVAALREVGVSLTDEQAELVKQLVETGDVAGAQQVILNELETEFGGLARAVGETTAGKFQIFKNQMGEVAEEIGQVFLPILTDVMDYVLKEGIPAVRDLGDRAKVLAARAIELGAGFVEMAAPLMDFIKDAIIPFVKQHQNELIGAFEAIGGVIVAAGVISGIASVAAGIVALFNPITLVVAGVMLLGAAWAGNWGGIRDKTQEVWDLIKPVLEDLWDWLKVKVPEALTAVQDGWNNTLKPALQELGDFVTANVLPVLRDVGIVLISGWNIAFTLMRTFWDTILRPALEAIWTFVTDTLLPILRDVADVLQNAWKIAFDAVKAAWDSVLSPAFDLFKQALDGIKSAVEWVRDNFNSIFSGIRITVPQGLRDLVDLVEKMVSKFGELFNLSEPPGWIKDLAGGLGGLLGLAEGGKVMPGETYLVGERGPELFTPATWGGITPNNQLDGMGNTYNYTLVVNSNGASTNLRGDFRLMEAWSAR